VRKSAWAAVLTLSAQNWTSGPQVATFLSPVDDSDQPYALYVPRDYTPSQKWPLVVSLHGAGSNHRLNLRRVFGRGNRPGESDAAATRTFPPLPEVPVLVASPLARGTMGYQTIAEQDVYDVLADVKKRFAIDEDRVYLTGLSMGGGGALWLGLTRPDVWAAIAAVCPAAPSDTHDLAGNALNVPVKLFHGEIDPVVPAVQSRAWHKRFSDLGVNSEYVEYPAVRHNSWDYAYKDASIFQWFLRHKRIRSPERVSFRATSYRHGSAYWLRFTRLTPGLMASFDGTLRDGRLVAKTANLDGFSVDANVRSASVDGVELKLRPKAPASFLRTAKGWQMGVPAVDERDKKVGAEGPVSDAISTRHVYVYGSGLRDTAAQAAEWSTPRSRLTLTFRVLSDKEARDSDLAGANLVLFGTRETNSLIAGMASKLPLHLNPGAADFGLVYVYPVDGRYVVVSSGLPWWTRLDQAQRDGLPFIAAPYRTLQSFGDYILFKGGLDNVIAEGRFDNSWKLPSGVVETLRATGAVEVR
jgi:pimeloyl-ACP methyl ester carboxylesterase